MFIGILRTHYEVYAIGGTPEDVQNNIVKGYKETYPKESREFESPTFAELNDFFGCSVIKINLGVGYAHE